jgi:hypothetical protein
MSFAYSTTEMSKEAVAPAIKSLCYAETKMLAKILNDNNNTLFFINKIFFLL